MSISLMGDAWEKNRNNRMMRNTFWQLKDKHRNQRQWNELLNRLKRQKNKNSSSEPIIMTTKDVDFLPAFNTNAKYFLEWGGTILETKR